MGNRNGGIRNESMKKLGTPSGGLPVSEKLNGEAGAVEEPAGALGDEGLAPLDLLVVLEWLVVVVVVDVEDVVDECWEEGCFEPGRLGRGGRECELVVVVELVDVDEEDELDEDELDDVEGAVEVWLAVLELVVEEDDDWEGHDSEVLATPDGSGSDEIGAPGASW
jgi:hypothetical protein